MPRVVRFAVIVIKEVLKWRRKLEFRVLVFIQQFEFARTVLEDNSGGTSGCDRKNVLWCITLEGHAKVRRSIRAF